MQERRRFLQGMAVATSVGVAGCSLGGNGASSDGGDGGGTPVEATFVDDCNDRDELADTSDTGNLGPDTSNTENFEHPDGSRDPARLNRVDSTADTALVYAPDGEFVSARAEFHWHQEAGGDVRVEASTDGGDSWSAASVDRTQFGGVDNAWLHAELATEFSEGVDRVRYVLTGGDQPWSGQLGHVEITVLTTDPDLSTPTPTEAPTPPPSPVPMGTTVEGSIDDVVFEAFVETEGADFVVDSEPAYFSGGNHPQVSRLDGGVTATDVLGTWTDLVPDLNVLRVPAFGEGQANYLQPEPGEYNERAFRLLDRVLYQFGRLGVRLVLPLANYWDWRGGIPQYVEWAEGAESKADFYTDEQCQTWYREFVRTVLERENTITGVQYKDDPTVMLWELANEPRAGTADYGTYRQWTKETAEFIKSIDDKHLVSTGMEGFYPDGPVGDDDSRYVETHSLDAIDACSFHLYPDAWRLSVEQGTEWIRTHTRMAAEEVGKPGYLGEFGAEVDRLGSEVDSRLQRRTDAYEAWYAAMVEEETDGAMVWDLRTEAEYESTHTWNLHAIYPRDEATIDVLDQYSAELTDLGGSSS
jgi:mannan endo-1,4-beta-mannosidase